MPDSRSPGDTCLISQEALQALASRAEEAWPGVEVSLPTFRAKLQAAGADLPAFPEDLWLACACLQGSAMAVHYFERDLMSQVPRYIQKICASDEAVDEMLQTLRVKLLTPVRGAPKLASYEGRSALRSWLRVVSVRTALNSRRDEKSRALEPLLDERLTQDGAVDPELDLLRLKYKPAFEQALQEVVKALPSKDRLLLRMRFLENLSVARIATMQGVHRSTVARRLATLLESCATQTRARVTEVASLTQTEQDSLLRLLETGLGVSLHSILVSAPTSPRTD